MSREQHVIPVGDEREHQISSWCWCLPDAEPVEEHMLYVHHAADLREAFEQATGEPYQGKSWIRVEVKED